MTSKTVKILGVPLDLGANMRGAVMGPAAIRIAELRRKIEVLGYHVIDGGDVDVPIRETLGAEAEDEHFLAQIHQVCCDLQKRVHRVLGAGEIPVILGGDHSIAIGTIAGVAQHFREQDAALGLIWIDAHADLNTPQSSPTGNIHGMPLSVCCGQGHERLTQIAGFAPKVRPENISLIGIRDIDGHEKEICRASGIRYFSMREVDEKGMHRVMEEAIAVASKGTAGIHLSVDMDGIDPLYAPGVSTPVTGGLSYREIHLGLEMIADTKKLSSIEIVELNPMTDTEHKTARLAVELVQSALGKSIV